MGTIRFFAVEKKAHETREGRVFHTAKNDEEAHQVRDLTVI